MDRLKLNDTTDTSPNAPLFNPNIGIHAPSGNLPPPRMFVPQEITRSGAAVAGAAQSSAQGIVDGGIKSRNSGTMAYHNPLPPPPGMGADNGPMSLSSGSIPYIPMPPPPSNSSSASQALSVDRRIPPPPPPPPSPPLPAPLVYTQSQSQYHSDQRQDQQHRHRDKHRSSSRGKKILKTVVLPREVLPRFLAIASLNTNANIETCGLLLGNEVCVDGSAEHGRWYNESGNNEREKVGEGVKRKSEYVVTTLLIPKQRATSDTCTMDGEELVLEFVDQRSLITLGWVWKQCSLLPLLPPACFLLFSFLFFFFYGVEGVLKLGLDSYASFAILFYVLGGLAYAFWVSEDVTGIGGCCVCAEE